MFPATLDLIRRVKATVGEHADFFNAVHAWYSDIDMARKAVRLLMARSSSGARVSLIVNGAMLAGEAVTVSSQAKSLSWVLAPGMLRAGANEIVVAVAPETKATLHLKSAAAAQETGLPREVVDFTARRPAGASHMMLTHHQSAAFDGDMWGVSPGGALTFHLQLSAAEPVHFTLGLSEEKAGAVDVADLFMDVIKKVTAKRRELEADRAETQSRDPSRAGHLTGQIASLTAYAQLHVSQIEPALLGPDDGTLRPVIERTGNPDLLIQAATQPQGFGLPPQPPQLPPRPPAGNPPPPLPRGGERPPPSRPAPSRPARADPPTPRPSASSGVGMSILAAFGGMVLIAAGVGYTGVSLIRPQPSVQIDFPAEGQTVAANAPLQVWVSADDEAGVQSVRLTVEDATGRLVETGPTPEQFTFPVGTKETGSKVFLLRLGPTAAGGQNLTLTAARTGQDGKTLSARRIITVGGTAQDLGYELVPAIPVPLQPVEVVVRVVNVAPGTMVTYSVRGTDTYKLDGKKPVEPDGTIRFSVEGAHKGVRDDIEAWIEGTAVRRRVSYEF